MVILLSADWVMLFFNGGWLCMPSAGGDTSLTTATAACAAAASAAAGEAEAAAAASEAIFAWI